MRCVEIVAWISIAGVLVIPFVSGVSDAQEGEPIPQSTNSQNKKLASPVDIPVYKPPLRSAPRGRVGGGSRGPGDQLPVLSVLAPDHTGLTVQQQPSLFWHLSSSATYPVELTIIDDQSVPPLLTTRFSPPMQSGVQRVRLADYGFRLLPGVQYQWFVALVVNEDRRSRDVIAGGSIERTELSDPLQSKLAQATKAEALHIYARAGLWYDAMTTISNMIDETADDQVLRMQRAALLEQVGLPEVAEYDRRSSPSN